MCAKVPVWSCIRAAMVGSALLWLCTSSPAAGGPADLSGLLVSCYRAGVASGHGIYQWDTGANAFKLVLNGGRHPTWSRDHKYWICYRNGYVWLQTVEGKTRLIPQAVGGNMRRFAQPMGRDGRGLVCRSRPWLQVYDTRKLLAAPEVGTDPIDFCLYPEYRPTREHPDGVVDPFWARVFGDVNPDQEGFSARWSVTDVATAPDDMTVAAVVQRWRPGIGLLGSWIYVWNWERRTSGRAVSPDDSRLEMNPHFVGGSRLLAFDTLTVADGTRRSFLADLASGEVRQLKVLSKDKQPKELPTWVLAASPDGTRLALGVNVLQRQEWPSEVAVATTNGEVKKLEWNPGAVWEVAWSPDSAKLACLGAQRGAECGYSTRGPVWFYVIDPSSDEYTLVNLSAAEDARHDDPLTPYELAW